MPYVRCGTCCTTHYVTASWMYAAECPNCGAPDVDRLDARGSVGAPPCVPDALPDGRAVPVPRPGIANRPQEG
jgi:hypothetical protein